jgi:hypothetical protein
MTARIRVKADRIISELTKFEVSSKNAMSLELERNTLARENGSLDEIEFHLKHPRDPSLMWLSRRWDMPKHITRNNIQRRISVLNDMSSLAQKSDDGWVEIDQGQTDFLDEIDLKLIEQSYRSDISNLKKENKKLKESIEELKKPKPNPVSDEEKQNAIQEVSDALDKLTKPPAPKEPEQKLDFWYALIGAVLILFILYVIFGSNQ